VIFEDGREIVTSSSVMSKDFTHGWNSSNYIFRVEVDGRVEHDYVFTIDGVPFAQMQRKGDLDKFNHSNDHKEKRTSITNSGTPPRNSNTQSSKNGSANKGSANKADESRSAFQSPKNAKNDSFDPFGTENGASDPFGGNSKPKPLKSEVSLLDDPVAPQSKQSNNFDPFGSTPDPFAPNPVKKSAQDFSNDFAGLSFAATPPPNPVFSQFSAETEQTADNLFDDDVPPVMKTPAKEVWSAPKNLVNLDFNAPPPASSSNAFSGRSPSLNLLLNGSNTRIQGGNGLNTPTPPKAPMNNNQGPMNGNQGQGPVMGGQGMQNNSLMGGNQNQMGFNGNNGMGMGQNQGQGMMHQQQQHGMGMNQGGQMGGGMGNQGQGFMSQQGQGMNQMQGNSMGMNQQGQGGMGGGMMNGGVANNRMMMPQGGNGSHLASTSGAHSSLTGSSIARGVPVTTTGPKSSLDGINWKM
jgi:hypothetical protein